MKSLLVGLTALLLAGCGPSRITDSTAATVPASEAPRSAEQQDEEPAVAASQISATQEGAAASSSPVDFDADVKPILVAHCMPCHFTGGKMYEKLPFDTAQTIRTLGEKLFTRIKDPQEQATIRALLAQPPRDEPAAGSAGSAK